jgi:hypothetical protein
MLLVLDRLGPAAAPRPEPPSPLELAAYVNATLLALWGAGRLAQGLERTEPVISQLTVPAAVDAGRPIRGIDSVLGPLGLTLALVVMNAVLVGLDYGPRVALATMPLDFIFELPLMTFFWVYAALLIGMNRLGRQRLLLNPTPGDRTLGLRPIGHLAFTGFWIFSLGFAPILIVSATSTPTLVLNLAFFLLGFGLFLLSLNRLHLQMAAAKRKHLDLARALYAEAYAPLARSPNVRTLRSQTDLLSAADALEKRNASIQEWPFDEILTGRIAIIVTSVVATVIARILLEALGI